MHTQQNPGQIAAAAGFAGRTHHHRRTTGAAVCARIGQKVSLALKTQAEHRRHCGQSRHRHVVPGVVKAERKTHNHQRRTHLHTLQPTEQVGRCEGAVHGSGGQGGALDLDHRHVDLARHVLTLTPQALAIAVQGNRELERLRHVARVDMQLNLQPVREVFARLVEHHVAAGDQEQPLVALKKETTGAGQQAHLLVGGDTGNCQGE